MAATKDMTDVVVVGAGVGGLTAAALLAARGWSVTVVERQEKVGGCCASLEVDDYRFDVGPTLFYGLGDKGMNAHRRVLDEIGAHLDVHRLDPSMDVVFGEERFCVSERLGDYVGRLTRSFPSCGRGLAAFYRKAERIYQDVAKVALLPVADASLFDLARVAFGNPGLLLTYLPILDQSLWGFMDPFLRSAVPEEVRKLKTLLNADVRFATGVSVEEAPLCLAVCLLMDRHVGGVFYPKGGSAALPRALAAGIESHGGELRLGTSVERILVKGGRVRGVRLESGEEIQTDCVISNAGVWATFDDLLDPGSVGESRREALEKLVPSFSAFAACVGLRRAFLPKDLNPHTVILPDSGDPRSAFDRCAVIYAPSILEPDLAPPGRHAITLMIPDCYSEWVSPGSSRARSDPALVKLRVSEALRRAERAIPGIIEQGEVMAVMGPAELESVAGRRFGSVGGPVQTLEQSLNRRQGNSTEIEGLYLVGDSTYPGEGVVAAAISGMTCVEQLVASDSSSTSPWASFFGRRRLRRSCAGMDATITNSPRRPH
jgi:prolycopene isomerase